MIVKGNSFPYNLPLYDAYVASGAIPAMLNLSSLADQEYIRNVWYSFLAPRQCSADWECQQFLRHGTPQCIFDSLGYVPWRNGDPAFASGVTGDEGGCNCVKDPFNVYANGYWDSQSFCQLCTAGFGPVDRPTWNLAVSYQAAILLEFPDLGYWPVFDPFNPA